LERIGGAAIDVLIGKIPEKEDRSITPRMSIVILFFIVYSTSEQYLFQNRQSL
jgi:hypothetical protein